MVQMSTFLKVIDNSGANVIGCIKIFKGYKARSAGIGQEIIVSVKTLRSNNRKLSKVLKGEKYKALIIRTKIGVKYLSGDSVKFLENSAVLINKKQKPVGTRIFGHLPLTFRHSKYLKLISLSSGIVY